MEDIDRTVLAAQWWQRITAERGTVIEAERAQSVLAALVEELAAGLDADPFDVTVGERVGAALAVAGLLESAAPTASAGALRRLAAASAVPDAQRRAAALLAAVVRGHREKGLDLSGVGASTVDMPMSRQPITEQSFRAALDNAALAVAIGNLDGTVRYANPALADLLGVPLEAIDTLTVFDFTHPEDADATNLQFLDRIEERAGTVRIECRMIRTDGEVRWTSVVVTYVPGSGGQPDNFVAVAEDVTERRRRQQQLHWQAGHDALTGLANRHRLHERIEEITAAAVAGDRIGLCFADVDEFKAINDRYGHAVGDAVLTEVAARLRATVDVEKYTVARIGGDEFVVLLPPPVDDADAVAVADALLSSLATPITVAGHRLRVSVSIGVAVTEVSGQRAATLLAAADRGLHRAKTGGRRRWAFHEQDSGMSTDLP